MFKIHNNTNSEVKNFGSGYTMQSFQDFCDSLPLGHYTVYFTGAAAQEILNIGSNYSLGEIFKRGNISDPQVLVRITPYHYGLPIYYLERNPAWSYKWQSEVHNAQGGGNKCSTLRRFFEGGGINACKEKSSGFLTDKCYNLSDKRRFPVAYDVTGGIYHTQLSGRKHSIRNDWTSDKSAFLAYRSKGEQFGRSDDSDTTKLREGVAA